MVSCTKESLPSQDDRFSVEEDVPQREIAMSRPPWRIPCLQLLWGCLALSMTINFLLMSPWSGSSAHLASYEEAPSPYGSSRKICHCDAANNMTASLTRSLAVAYVHQTKYWVPGNKTPRQELWDDIEIAPGLVALENEFVESKHLPRAQGFPWDSNKSVYVLQAYHNLHCLVSITHRFPSNPRSCADTIRLSARKCFIRLSRKAMKASSKVCHTCILHIVSMQLLINIGRFISHFKR